MENRCPAARRHAKREREREREEASLSDIVASSLDGIAYVNDIETYEVLWHNEVCLRYFPAGQKLIGRKCHQVFQGLDAPCPFCPMPKLTHSSFYVWEHHNAHLGKVFRVKDKLISFRGRPLHLEFATDITDLRNENASLQTKLDMADALLACVRTLLKDEEFGKTVNNALQLAGQLYKADRCYVFEVRLSAANETIIVNTHEWCEKGVTQEKDGMQHVPYVVFAPWLAALQKRNHVSVGDLEAIRDAHPALYALLKPQGIVGIYVVPLRIKGLLAGFVGVDNPRANSNDLSLLQSLAHFIGEAISRDKVIQGYAMRGLRDDLTGLANRNAYLDACQAFSAAPARRMGIIFIDLNNLKEINDTLGHEAGDAFIQGMSAIFTQYFRSEDIFRIGGDEFVFICKNIREDTFQLKLENMRKECEAAYPGGLALGFLWEEAPRDIAELVQRADELMYQEKMRIKARQSQERPVK